MITAFAQKHQLPAFRITQFNQAFYKEVTSSFDELTTWPKELREKLKKVVTFSTISPIKQLKSLDDGTEKVLFKRLSDKKLFESVLMQHKDGRNTVCVSCMIGCPLGCKFCATGKMKFIGNLSSQEIIDQALYFARILTKQNQTITNIVFMGMGEPLLNLEQVLGAIKIFNDPEFMGYGIRRITISTSGITPKIYELMKSGYKGRLALSLHAPDQKLREIIMPIAKKYLLPELISTVKAFATRTQLRVSYEYILIDQLNDQPKHARALAKLIGSPRNLEYMPGTFSRSLRDKHISISRLNKKALRLRGKKNSELVHVNLIPFNPVIETDFKRSPLKSVYSFAHTLTDLGIPNTVRVTMGNDIKAACGQLATE